MGLPHTKEVIEGRLLGKSFKSKLIKEGDKNPNQQFQSTTTLRFFKWLNNLSLLLLFLTLTLSILLIT